MTTNQEIILSASDVEVQFTVRGKQLRAIRNISIDLYKDETLAIVGESGSGKSVFTKTFTGMLESNGKVTKIISKDEDCYIHLKDDNSAEVLIAVIDKSKCEVKVGDYVNFVGTIDIENGQIKLSKISTEEINYNSSTKLELNELIDNIKLVKNTYFIVSGYLVTEGEVYKLFDSKDDYTENNKAGYYFKIKWDGSFGYTGKQQVSLKCNLSSSYTLVNCTLSE